MKKENLNNQKTDQIDAIDASYSYITYSQYQDALKIINEYKRQLEEKLKLVKIEIEGISKPINYSKDALLYDVCSSRLLNTLHANDDKLGITFNSEIKLKDLNGLSINKFSRCRVVGKKTIQELRELCFYSGVELSN